MNMHEESLSAALKYIDLGWPVFPLYSANCDGECTCGNDQCSSPGKHPMTSHGLKDASTDEIKEHCITNLYDPFSGMKYYSIIRKVHR